MSKKIIYTIVFLLLTISQISTIHAQTFINENKTTQFHVAWQPYQISMNCTPNELRCGDAYQETPYPRNYLIKCNNAGNGYDKVEECYTCITPLGKEAKCSTPADRIIINSMQHFYLYVILLLIIIFYFKAVKSYITKNSIFVIATIIYGLSINLTILSIEGHIFTENFIALLPINSLLLIGSPIIFAYFTKFKKRITYSLTHLGLLILTFMIFILGVISMME
jgi:hypothetical protein